MKVYTRTGDKGTSQLFSGERRAKTDRVFHALGAVDETNSMIGLALQFVDSNKQPKLKIIEEQIEEILSRMFDVGSCIATPIDTTSSSAKLKRAAFDENHVDHLEKMIDTLDEDLEPLRNFVLPSGGVCSAHLHVARTIARRAERQSTILLETGSVEPSVTKYLNRLSDYLFTAARYVALHQGHKEIVYKKEKT